MLILGILSPELSRPFWFKAPAEGTGDCIAPCMLTCTCTSP